MINKYKHIVMVSLDTLRSDCINLSPKAYGFKKQYNVGDITLKTNILDSIIKKGTFYNECYTVAGYTSASHASYFSGFWPKNNGIFEYFNRNIKKKTIFEYGKKNGFETIFQTDFPIILGEYLGLNKGVDNYFIEDEYGALNLLKNKSNSNTISFFHFGGIHYPYGFHTKKFGGELYIEKIEKLEKKYKISPDFTTLDLHDESYRTVEDKVLLKRYKTIIKYMYDNSMYDELFKLYLEGVNYFMENRLNPFLNDLVDFIDNNNGLLVIFSDHGEGWHKDCYGHYNSLDNSVINTPLIFYGKDIPNQINNNLIRSIDLLPTLYDFISSNKENKFDGLPLDIFSKNNYDEKNRYIISQFWDDFNMNKYHKFHKKILQNGKIYKSLKNTFLSKEKIKFINKELIKHYDVDGNNIYENSIGIENKADYDNLSSILNNYNDTNKFFYKKNRNINIELKEYFNDLGYNI